MCEPYNDMQFSFSECYFILCLITTDELVNKMKIGNEYKIIGIPVCIKTSQTALCVEANSITPYTAKGKLKHIC